MNTYMITLVGNGRAFNYMVETDSLFEAACQAMGFAKGLQIIDIDEV